MKVDTFTTPRLSAAMPLILGLATMAAAPTVRAVTFDQVDICDGLVEVTEGACPADLTDDQFDVVLWCNTAMPVRVDIVNGFVDVDEDGILGEALDHLENCDLADYLAQAGSHPHVNRVDIIAGKVDVNEDGVVNAIDDAADIKLFDLP